VGLGVMIGSFRGTVERWLARTLQADVYVSAPSPVASRPEGTLEPADVDRLASAPTVEGVSLYRSVVFPSQYGETRLVAVDLHPSGDAAYRWVEGEDASPLAALRRGGAVIVSEPFAFRHAVGVGSTVRLPTPQGERGFEVAGVFYDYGSDRGVVMMSLAAYRSIWGDSAVTSMGIFLRPGVDAGEAAEALRTRLTGASPVLVRSNRDLREGSLAVFDRTFEITRVLRLLALVVAFVGVVGALMALQLERGRELAVLRATGVTPAQVWLLVTAQTGLMGLSAGLLSLPLGALLAVLMTHVVNRRSFGWTLELAFPPGVLLQALALSLGAALLAGVYPAVRMSRTPPAAALRGE
jgi:putative ABC transport system permease protein